ncbi:Septin-domain-containing protein [Scheffersomyces coipomensis]|uniref:Septin-domain-containing protein n=1 Tax=Scheffersomyces coipomensis TaxID=1788519 RepID=UPI00315D1E9E
MDQSYTYESPSMISNSPMINYRKDAKKGVKFTFMVVGESGNGKTTFINSLLNKKVLSHRFENASDTDTKTLTFTSAKSVALPNTSILTRQEFNARTSNEEPGIALTETKVELIDDENLKLLLSIIDTPGFGENLNNELCFLEIENYLKQQFDLVLAEETRIKRNPRFIDTRVHALLYFITPTGHGLREIDIQCMKRLSKYVNIIPVIGRADTFTETELKHFKTQIKIDIEKFNVPIFQFDSILHEFDEDEDYELIQECKYLAALQPFAIITSEEEFEVKDPTNGQTNLIRGRQLPWGLIDINDTQYSDFPILKSVLLGSHLQDFKDLTHDFLYETYRTERLTKVTGGNNNGGSNNHNDDEYDDSEFHDTVEHHNEFGANSVPSLSNLAQLTNLNTTLGSSITNSTSHNGDDESLASNSSISRKKNTLLLDDDDDDEDFNGTSKTKDNGSFTSSTSTISFDHGKDNIPPPRNLIPTNGQFKRLSIAPQRNQLRQISETVPYVIRHERILERQQKLEEMEMASAKELAHRAALLEKKAAELKLKERALMKRLESVEKPKSNNETTNDDDGENDGDTTRHSTITKDETLTDLHSYVEQRS